MSSILDMIHDLKKKGFDDHKILKKVKNKLKSHKRLNQRGGNVQLTGENVETSRNQPFFVNGGGSPETLSSDNFNEDNDVASQSQSATAKLKMLDSVEEIKMTDAQPTDENIPEITVDDMAVTEKMFKKTETIGSALRESKGLADREESASVFDKIEEGTILYFPSSDISRFDKSNLIFVNLKKVIDRNNKRSFTMFFTENKAYAFMFGGLSSLNNRDVFIHEFQVKDTIEGIKRIHPNILSKDVENIADGFCGVTEDGRINGIKIERKTDDQNINEYYICDPESKLTHMKTYIKISDTEFLPYTEEDIERTKLPVNY